MSATGVLRSFVCFCHKMQTLGLSEMRLLIRSCVVESQPRVKAAVAMSLKIAPIIYFFIYPFFLLDTSSFPLLH